MSYPTTVFYAWKEVVRDSYGGTRRYVIPMSDHHQYEYPYDFLFETPEEARKRLQEDIDDGFFGDEAPGEDEMPNDWVLIKITEEPVG